MYPRLQLLQELLSEDGVLLVSIDGIEVHNLRAVLDEIFGDDRRLGEIVWKTRNTDNRVKTNLSIDHEYVLVYGKAEDASLQGRVIDRSDFDNPDDDPRGSYVTDPLTGMATARQRPNLHFVVENPQTGDKYDPDPSRGWRVESDVMSRLIADGKVWWPPDPNTGKPRKRRYLSETKERMPESSFWADIRGQSGADEVDLILGERLFDFPKLTDFIVRLLDVTCPDDVIVLDSTAGSGTTAHAVLKLNAENSGKRSFILVQQPYDNKDQEKARLNICRRVTAERVRKAIKGYKYTKPKRGGGTETHKVPGLGGSFTYARLSAKPLFGEYKDFGDGELPSYEDIAKYVFYTETNHQWLGSDRRKNKAYDKKIGRIGEYPPSKGGLFYYLLYKPNRKYDWGIDIDFLNNIASKDPNHELVVYCEKVWVHKDQLRQFERENKKKLRHMLVPFNLK